MPRKIKSEISYKRNSYDLASAPNRGMDRAGWTQGMINPFTKRPREARNQGVYKEFDATELFCPRCRKAVPVRKRLLLVLPEGEKYEYLCALCSITVGTKISREQKAPKLIL